MLAFFLRHSKIIMSYYIVLSFDQDHPSLTFAVESSQNCIRIILSIAGSCFILSFFFKGVNFDRVYRKICHSLASGSIGDSLIIQLTHFLHLHTHGEIAKY